MFCSLKVTDVIPLQSFQLFSFKEFIPLLFSMENTFERHSATIVEHVNHTTQTTHILSGWIMKRIIKWERVKLRNIIRICHSDSRCYCYFHLASTTFSHSNSSILFFTKLPILMHLWVHCIWSTEAFEIFNFTRSISSLPLPTAVNFCLFCAIFFTYVAYFVS